MEMVDEYFCWLEGQSEGDAKVVKSDSVKEAARLAVDSWRHEGTLDTRLPSLLVKVRDADGHIHQIRVSQNLFMDEAGPQA